VVCQEGQLTPMTRFGEQGRFKALRALGQNVLWGPTSTIRLHIDIVQCACSSGA